MVYDRLNAAMTQEEDLIRIAKKLDKMVSRNNTVRLYFDNRRWRVVALSPRAAQKARVLSQRKSATSFKVCIKEEFEFPCHVLVDSLQVQRQAKCPVTNDQQVFGAGLHVFLSQSVSALPSLLRCVGRALTAFFRHLKIYIMQIRDRYSPLTADRLCKRK